MENDLCKMFGIEVPIFAFSHCRDVVVEVSKAGGLGVLGMGRQDPARLEEVLSWIDAHIDGKPYGIDVLMASTYEDVGDAKFDPSIFPPEQLEFLRSMLDRAGVPRLPPDEEEQIVKQLLGSMNFTPQEHMALLDICFNHPIKLIVSALGTPPKELIDKAHQRGIKIAALAGKVKHALKHKKAGCDMVIAIGTEAGGHTGDITSLVLWPSVADAVAPLPVLGGGGVGRGRQLAAALALGCQGVWCGSVWLTTIESEVIPEIKSKFFTAESEDAVLTKSVTGKQCRTLRSKFTDAWEAEGAPPTLPAPSQGLLWWGHGRTRVERVRAKDYLTYPVGQIVGDMKAESSVRQVVQDMLMELAETKERLDHMLE
jgi:NAD(P)H-dependent flavin oxidoreductase YrpB (nitropropane dioxygenase family)